MRADATTPGKITETIKIIGMTCTGCARTLENELRTFKDIDYTVSFADKSITIVYSPDDYTRADFEQAVTSHGYTIQAKA
ncbi:heavy-metal-associated domain-containing protein [Thermodesulfobacteriota bacterium]